MPSALRLAPKRSAQKKAHGNFLVGLFIHLTNQTAQAAGLGAGASSCAGSASCCVLGLIGLSASYGVGWGASASVAVAQLGVAQPVAQAVVGQTVCGT